MFAGICFCQATGETSFHAPRLSVDLWLETRSFVEQLDSLLDMVGGTFGAVRIGNHWHEWLVG